MDGSIYEWGATNAFVFRMHSLPMTRNGQFRVGQQRATRPSITIWFIICRIPKVVSFKRMNGTSLMNLPRQVCNSEVMPDIQLICPAENFSYMGPIPPGKEFSLYLPPNLLNLTTRKAIFLDIFSSACSTGPLCITFPSCWPLPVLQIVQSKISSRTGSSLSRIPTPSLSRASN